MTKEWWPDDDQINDMRFYWSCVKEDVEKMMYDVGCPRSVAAGMLRDMADRFENDSFESDREER